MPGTPISVPMLTTGLDGATSTTSDDSSASRTSGSTRASSAPTDANRCAAGLAWWRTHHSWKCTATCGGASGAAASGLSMTTWVSTRSSVTGSSRTPGRQRWHKASVTCESGYPARSIRERTRCVAMSRSPRENQSGSAP